MQNILSHFNLSGAVAPLGSGHINDSYRVGDDYLLQRINHEVFPDVTGLMNNINLVTGHIRQKIARSAGEAAEQQTLRIIPTTTGELFTKDEAGNYWRVYRFLTGLHSHDLLETPEQAYAGARSYGHFFRFLDDFPVGQITDVIPNFHNIISRLEAFEIAVKNDSENRVRECRKAIDYVYALADRMTIIQRVWAAGKLRTRVTHNDTKFNNVMFDAAGNGRCVVDLDTVMRGVVHFDFGDAIRTGAATANEDEADLQIIGIDKEKAEAITEGYLSLTRDFLTPEELELLPRSGELLAYLMAARFLTDYLTGDRYYKIAYPEHNLIRGRNQLQLVRSLVR
ncbi:phosphotransferase enzyme family protein [Neolewinella aurantiaca]|uniref:phosphotransferase enzyme family protein n=1 Tax=Neolewinella aurantiaca TaxID=2602767 RepID=UPI00164EF998|nr:aminoglycoside phosphotransferase family protein [Neolewinella aurantiaca]